MDTGFNKNKSGNADKRNAGFDAALKNSVDASERAEKDLQQQLYVFRGIIENIDSLIFSVDRQYRYTGFNLAHAQVMKTIYDADIEIGHSLLDYMTILDDRKRAKQNIDRALAGEYVKEEASSGEGQHARLFFEVCHSPIKADDEIIGVSIIAKDVTERKQADETEEALKGLSQRNEMILNSTGEGIYGTDVDGNILFINPSAAKMLGFETQELIGENSHQLFHHTRADGSPYPVEECPLRKSLKQGQVYRGEEEVFWTRDGNRFEVEHVNTPLIDNGKVVGAVVVFRDITESKKAKKAVRSANAYNRSLIEASLDPLVTISREGKITDVNQATEKVTGHSRDKLIGTDFSNYFTEPEKAQAGYQKVFREGLVQDFELGIRHQDGPVTSVLYNASLYTDESGDVVGVFAAARDITELKQAQEQKQRVAEVEAANRDLEAFSYSISHDLRAPLRAIDGFTRIIVDDYRDRLDEEGRRLLNVVRDNAQKMGDLIDDILSLSRLGHQQIKPSEIDMKKLAQSTFEELRATAPERKIILKVKNPPPAHGDRALIKQMMSNLLGNAIKFTGNEETAVIEVGGSRESGECSYYVKDNGAGFDMQYADKLFGIFQRLHTDEEFEGTGVGLSIVQRIVQRHGGRVWAEGKVDEGATFYFTLPEERRTNERAE